MNELLKTLVSDGEISVSVLDTTDMVNEAIRIHNLSPVCAAALGRYVALCPAQRLSSWNENGGCS